jgi:apolipoprotein N-acyltransferase
VTRQRRAALVAGYAAATFLAFPQPVAGYVLDLGILLGIAAPALLLTALQGLGARAAAGVAFGACWLAHACVLHWIYVVTVRYGHAPPVVGVLAPSLLALYPALCGAAFGAAWSAVGPRAGLAAPWLAAALWTALYDHARAFFLTGFPWATLGYAQHLNFVLLPLATWTGVYGLSFVSVLGGATWVEARAGRRNAAVVAGSGVLAAHLLGMVIGITQEPPAGPSVRVAVLQGNIDQGVKWSDAWRERTLGIYEELTREAARQGAELIVWPETAVPGALEADAATHARIRALARETNAWLVVGSVGLDWSDSGRPSAYYDSAFLFDAAGELRERYDKTHLVPFGEYVPFRDLLGVFVSSVARGVAPDDVAPGDRPRALQVATREGVALRAGVPVCYELLFPDLVRRFAVDGAELLLGITNDAWYGATGAPYQFLAITRLRSVETGLWTARAANTGVSAFIDARGQVRAETRIFEQGLLVADVPRREDPREATVYVRFGDVFVWSCWLAGAAALAAAWRLRMRAANQ